MHAHCNLDPEDYGFCTFSPEQLILEAARQDFSILSITCHNLNSWTSELADYAGSLGITLIPGMEITVEKTRHVLVYNLTAELERLNSLETLQTFSNDDTLIVAPHPFYPGRSCLRNHFEKNLNLFDAVEYSGFVVPGLNFNRRAMKIAEKYSKPVLGFGDIHRLWQLGRTFTWIYAEPDTQSIFNAIKQGRVRIETSPLSYFEAASWFGINIWRKIFPVNSELRPSDKIKNGRSLGTAQESMKSQSVHIGQ